jgi:hypothetical protein
MFFCGVGALLRSKQIQETDQKKKKGENQTEVNIWQLVKPTAPKSLDREL